MKTTTTSRAIRALAWASVLTFGFCAGVIHAQTTLDLDSNPSFDFGNDPPTDPLFAPEMLGLTNGTAAYNRVAAVSAWAAAAKEVFPPSHEVFIAYWGNPRYALLTDPAAPATALAATSPLSLTAAFRGRGGAGGAQGIVPGRTAGFMYAEATQVSLAGVLYELPAPTLYVSPLVLDLDGDGLLSASRSLWQPHPARLTGPYAAFDIDGDGFKDITEWIGAGDALLVTSPNPTSGRDLVGTVGGWRDGFAHLRAAFDLDQNGWVEGAELNGLYVWQDANTNGLAEPGEVLSAQSARIDGLDATHSGDYAASFSYTGGATGRLWDWWPNYALALQRRWAQQAEAMLLGQNAMAAIRNILFGRVVDDNSPPRTAGLIGPRHIPPEQLAAAGIDLATFRMALLADGGRVIIGYDTSETFCRGPRVCARLLRIQPGPNAAQTYVAVTNIVLPFEEVYQLACNPAGRLALVLGDHGSKLALVDFETGAVAPPEGLELRSIGLRASGLAGDPMVRYSGTGNFWFSGWQLNELGEVVDERVWAITPWGFWGGLSLQALRSELGQLRSHCVTGPTSGFFAVPGPWGTNEQLWSIVGTNRTLVDTADSFGGIAVSVCAKARDSNHYVTYTKRDGSRYRFAIWQGDTNVTILGADSAPFFYPSLTDGGGTAIAAQLSPETRTLKRHIWTVLPAGLGEGAGGTPTNDPALLTTYPGQDKVSHGAFAHYGTNGIDIIPMPDEPAATPPRRLWNYTLLPGSQLTDDCLICGRPPIVVPMQGTFQLRLVEENPLFSTYAVESLAFDAGGLPGTSYKVRGKGLYHVGGEVGVLQNMVLEVQIESAFTNRVCYFTNRTSTVDRRWPMIHLTLDQTSGLELQTFTLELNAAPLRQIWFSTVSGMTSSHWQPPTNTISPGDLISAAGRVVKRNEELTRNLGIMPIVADLGLDAMDVLTHGEIVFSLEQGDFSESLGSLQHGDLLSERGRIVARNQDLTRAFVILPPVPDVGLDAVQVRDDGEIYFSIETPIFSGTGGMLGRGDVLSDRGVIVKNNAQLLARFHPPKSHYDYGLDALYVWSSGEIWFSLEEGFQDGLLGPIQAGDLLSDQGYIVFRNLELVSAFAPIEDLSDFGLDALYVLFGDVPRLDITRSASGLILEWEAPLGILQEADAVTGPWRDVSPAPVPSPYVIEHPAGRRFYRLEEP